MKKSILLSLVVLLLLSACGDGDRVTLMIYGPDNALVVNDLVFPDTEGQATLTLNLALNDLSNVTLECDDPKNPWCQLSYAGVLQQISIDYSANEQMTERFATLRFYYSGSTRTVNVIQSPKLGIWGVEQCYVVPKEGGQMTITFQKNTECGVGQGMGSDAFSITGISQEATSSTVTVDISPNRGFGRVLTLVIKPAGARDVEIALWQQPRDFASSEDIVLSEAGTLAARMGCDYGNIANINDLTLAGKINGADIAFLRQICNRQFMCSNEGVPTTLENLNLDLMNTFIQDGCNSKFAEVGVGQPQSDQMVTTVRNVIPQRMLTGSTRLVSVSLPETATRISDHAFYYCPQLTFVRLPRDIEVIGNSAFQSCEKLTDVDFGDIIINGSRLTTIEEYAFSDIGVLKSFYFPATLVNLPRAGLNFKVKSLYALWTTPPAIQNGPDPEDCTLYVPNGCGFLYSTAPYWSEFPIIVEM